jgi:hypothetical protein
MIRGLISALGGALAVNGDILAKPSTVVLFGVVYYAIYRALSATR